MIIEITHAMSVEIVSAFGVWIGRTHSQEHREKIAHSANEFVESLPEDWKGNARELLQGTITRWSPSPISGHPTTVEAGRRVDEERDSRQTGGPTAHLEPASHHPATTFAPVSDAN